MTPAPKSILLIEDNSDDEQLTMRAIRALDVPLTVQIARDGAEAIEMLFGTGADCAPDLVLLDLKLPRVGGIDVLSRIRSESSTRNLPVVVLSSSDEARDIAECYGLGANSFIRKPIDFDEYMDAVRQLGAYWLAVNVAPSRSRPTTR